MTRAGKIAIAAAVGGVALVLSMTAAAVWWFQSQGGLEGMADQAHDVMAEGQAWAREGHGQDECLGGALEAIGPGCRGIRCAVKAQFWAQACMEVADPTPGMCDEVPGTFEILKTARWQLETCKAHGRPNDKVCQQTASVIQAVCEQR